MKKHIFMELMVSNGRIRTSTKNKSDDSPLGLISMDSLFSPVKKFLFQLKILEQGVL